MKALVLQSRDAQQPDLDLNLLLIRRQQTALVLVEDVPHMHFADQRDALVSAVQRMCASSRSLCVIVHSDAQHGDGAGMFDWPVSARISRLPSPWPRQAKAMNPTGTLFPCRGKKLTKP